MVETLHDRYPHTEDAMAKVTKKQGERERFGKCAICMEYIPIEYYFSIGDAIVCYECGTEYVLSSKDPVKLTMLEVDHDPDDYYGDKLFND